MKQLTLRYGFQYALTAVALTLSAPVMAGQIDSVCKTDDQTFNSIKSDPDQTLWNFMQAVCQGEFVITQAPTRPQSLAVNTPTPKASFYRAEVELAKTAKADVPELPVERTINTPTNNSPDQSLGTRDNSSTLPKQSSLEVIAQPAETNLPPLNPAGAPNGQEHTKTEAIAQVLPEETRAKAKDLTINSDVLNETPIAAKQIEEEKTYQSARPWLYSLLVQQTPLAVLDTLPDPIEYKPSRFSNYKPDYVGESTASNHRTGYLQKPGVMSVVPQGFYLGTSLFGNRNEPTKRDAYSALPSLTFGYADEKAVREFQSYPGLGSRFEVKVERSMHYEDRTKWNEYSALGEIYVPVGGGVFAGVGGMYEFDRKIPVPGAGSYDANTWYAYLPIGIGFTTNMGHSGRIQLNSLIQAQSKSKLSQLTSASYSNPTAKFGLGDAYGADFTYSWNAHSEAFVKYWWFNESDPYLYTVNGTQTTDRTGGFWELDVGYRLYW